MEVSLSRLPLPAKHRKPTIQTHTIHRPDPSPQKFTKWADKGTSVNPFLPPREASRPLPARALGWLGGLLLVTLRLPFLLVALGWLALAAVLSHPLTNLAGGLGTCLNEVTGRLSFLATCHVLFLTETPAFVFTIKTLDSR